MNWSSEYVDPVSLRDHFAGLAMQAYCSDPSWRRDIDRDSTARIAYEMADAMLKARDGK